MCKTIFLDLVGAAIAPQTKGQVRDPLKQGSSTQPEAQPAHRKKSHEKDQADTSYLRNGNFPTDKSFHKMNEPNGSSPVLTGKVLGLLYDGCHSPMNIHVVSSLKIIEINVASELERRKSQSGSTPRKHQWLLKYLILVGIVVRQLWYRSANVFTD